MITLTGMILTMSLGHKALLMILGVAALAICSLAGLLVWTIISSFKRGRGKAGKKVVIPKKPVTPFISYYKSKEDNQANECYFEKDDLL